MDAIGRRASDTALSSRSQRGHRLAVVFLMAAAALALLVIGARTAYPSTPVLGHARSPVVPTDADGALWLTSSEYPWTLAPVDEHITIIRATFDKGGYQLRTASGNLIVVPFTENNLFSMKFALTDDGNTYFVNSGPAPVLYMPSTGYLENATMHTAVWYPFTKEFRPEVPVYAAMAPNYNAFTSMSWYTGMKCRGSFWTDTPFGPSGLVIQSVGLNYVVNRQVIEGWTKFRAWTLSHPSTNRTAYADPDLYRRIGQTHRLFAHKRLPPQK